MGESLYMMITEDYKEVIPVEATKFIKELKDNLGKLCITSCYENLMMTRWITVKEDFLKEKYPELLPFTINKPRRPEFLVWCKENLGEHPLASYHEESGVEDKII
jgi:hypothetical protein